MFSLTPCFQGYYKIKQPFMHIFSLWRWLIPVLLSSVIVSNGKFECVTTSVILVLSDVAVRLCSLLNKYSNHPLKESEDTVCSCSDEEGINTPFFKLRE